MTVTKAQIGAYVTQACKPPVKIPDSALTSGDVENLWAQDRKALVWCGISKKQVIAFFSKRDGKKY